jgi:hypothetical protein
VIPAAYRRYGGICSTICSIVERLAGLAGADISPATHRAQDRRGYAPTLNNEGAIGVGEPMVPALTVLTKKGFDL